MKSIACVLLFASLASAQLVRGAQVQNNRAAAAPAEAGAATAKSLGAAPPAGGAAPAAPAPAAPAAPVNDFGPAFFGPGVGNFAARAPLPALVARAREVAASDPNVRVFVDVDGTIEFTDKFGREVEVLDAFGRDALEIPGLEEQIELQQQQFQLERRRALLTQELNNLNILAGGAAGGAPGAAGAAAAAPAFRIVA
ncbi:uncharacterized protein LOC108667424 [Hyalella azteca]|uniref:Uncharacterized protein LOC108667424 n=1 Tax=Hyalella azteca TaxID=294128 RepID=A0A8B7N7R2_HYAAZ|nr:uncharacterized protein LOC108667424 [Hyalella azteca]